MELEELVADEADYEAGFADGGVAEEDELEVADGAGHFLGGGGGGEREEGRGRGRRSGGC